MDSALESYINVFGSIWIVRVILTGRLVLTIEVVGKRALISMECLENLKAFSLVGVATSKLSLSSLSNRL